MFFLPVRDNIYRMEVEEMEILSNFAETLEELIFEHKTDIKQFSKDMKISLSEVYYYLERKGIPRFPKIIEIADYFNCSVDYILGLAPFQENANYKKTPPFHTSFQRLLKSKNIYRYRLCKECHFYETRVDSWYHGKSIPSTDNAIKLAKYFDCSVDSLLGRE